MLTMTRMLSLACVLLLSTVGQSRAQTASFDRPVQATSIEASELPTPPGPLATPDVVQNEVTVFYYATPSIILGMDQELPAVLLRMTAPLDGFLKHVNFTLYDGGDAAGIQGTGPLTIKVFALADFPNSLPGLDTEPIAAVEVPFSELSANANAEFDNLIDLTSERIAVERFADYILMLSFDGGSEDAGLSILLDQGSLNTSDTNYYPPRTLFYLRGETVPDGGTEGYYAFQGNQSQHHNMLIDFTVTDDPQTSTDNLDVPDAFALHAAYPNPFNPQTTLRFTLPQAGPTTLTIYDAQGRAVTTLLARELPAGTHTATWNATSLPSGVYFARLQAAGQTKVRTLTLLK